MVQDRLAKNEVNNSNGNELNIKMYEKGMNLLNALALDI